MAKQRIAALDDVPEGGNKAFDACGKSVLLCRTGAGVFAIENMCSHAFAHLEGGKVRGPHIFCPLHGVRFDMRTGAPNGTLTKKPIAVYPVSVEDGEIVVDLPDG
ncbi:Rieske (2Fe-2S) protein [Rhizorhabdus wittichii]|jgi:3-phenylpropionate/trans-cinnamate dioxygenase ferredoxin subunit|uniref:Rieske (2Fe-2S) domain protein n=1 Tax=Rhizorhabdus wittichii (strain DSM 6014 / CCUG 31198 / JCM 15750 / NBRC 105917 / EY 4224 / RW1) TaxID=392499 RepID=A0A9J9HBL0_RHIWR|nr:Rieske 2Fe-2S domain-containing protein [Rhizorhabdus wittichii]ABQ68610.1 Rieske (2Fe-2S) domain protein [Rhizorhabdus wittichii RW1]